MKYKDTDYQEIGHVNYPSEKYRLFVSVAIEEEIFKKLKFDKLLDDMATFCSYTKEIPSVGHVYYDNSMEYSFRVDEICINPHLIGIDLSCIDSSL